MFNFFKTHSEREILKIQPIISHILSLEDKMQILTDDDLKNKTIDFKDRILNGESLDSILPEAFAVCREAAWRVIGLKAYPVQLMGGVVLHQGRIAEMKTGEGKTLVAVFPAYLNALTGNGVHIVTVNDYLAKRDFDLMGKIFRFLGLTVGLITHDTKSADRKKMYNADVTYGTNNEIGFDYLRDNMAVRKEDVCQRGHFFAIVDEVDSILIDEARTPLIISGKGEMSSSVYFSADRFAKGLLAKTVKEFDADEELLSDDNFDYIIDEKGKNVILTENGIKKAEKFFNIENFADIENSELVHRINQAIRANGVMKRDIDYIVKDNQVVIVDEFTGRLMYGRRYNDGLHQAIEAKESLEVIGESKTYATVTFQNLFRMYSKLSGMTGTAKTEEVEFQHIYKLDVVCIPTNKPVVRIDHDDNIYATFDEKMKAIIYQIKECNKKGQPVLIGTVSVEKSEALSAVLRKEGIQHNVLNAKNHEQEAMIIAQAGKFGSVTIATNMAGRGTDILLGGNADYLALKKLQDMGISDEILTEATGFADTKDEVILEVRNQYKQLSAEYKKIVLDEAEKVKAAGGLFILGTERHESRRIDNQLRGRAGRQGDVGESRFFLSMEDSLIRLFIPEGIVKKIINSGFEKNEPINTKMLSKAVESAQKTLEGRSFEIRKNILLYDDVLNKQRIDVYSSRKKIIEKADLNDDISDMITEFSDEISSCVYNNRKYLNREIFDSFVTLMNNSFNISSCFLFDDGCLSVTDINNNVSVYGKNINIKDFSSICSEFIKSYFSKMKEEMSGDFNTVFGNVFLKTIDFYWMDHIDNMSKIKDGIGLRAYGQIDPVIAYKENAFFMFDRMIVDIKISTILSMGKLLLKHDGLVN